MSTSSPPRNRRDFHVAIICALPLEAENVQSVFDRCWEDEGNQYGKVEGDQNAYTTGVIGKHNVVLAHMPNIGGTSASAVAAGLRTSFPSIKLALVVGICGAVPIHVETQEEIVLGDIIVSTSVTQYDFGRHYPNGFQRKKEIEDSLGRASPEIRAFARMLQVRQNRQRLTRRLAALLQSERFQKELPDSRYPGATRDRLYEASYIHQHRLGGSCEKCDPLLKTCSKSCDELDCEEERLIVRNRHSLPKVEELTLPLDNIPVIHFGRFGSANTTMKSGMDRDRIAEANEIIAFEMEGAGIWEQYATVIIKAACDYADSHKNKDWQPYAAAMAAGGLKAFLEEWRSVDITECLTNIDGRQDRSQKAINQANEAMQNNQREAQIHKTLDSNLTNEAANSVNNLYSLLLWPVVTVSLIIATFERCVQVLLRSSRSYGEMIVETEQSLQVLTESQGEIEAAKESIIFETEYVGRLRSELAQEDFREEKGCVRNEAFDEDYGLILLFGEECDDADDDVTFYDIEPQIGRDDSEAIHTPAEIISHQTEQTQTDQNTVYSSHKATNDREAERELLHHRIATLQNEKKELTRTLRQLRVEIEEREAALEDEKRRKTKVENDYTRAEEEKKRRSSGWFGWCIIL